jgi:predicted PurR-regulated permease PerM
MRSLICIIAVLLALTACDNAKEQGQQTVRTLSGGQMLDQKNAAKQQLNKVEQEQKERYDQLNEQMNEQNGQ